MSRRAALVFFLVAASLSVSFAGDGLYLKTRTIQGGTSNGSSFLVLDYDASSKSQPINDLDAGECTSSCKIQTTAIAKLDEYTSDRYIEQAFGVPTKENNLKFARLAFYEGVYANLFVVKSKSGDKKLAYALIARDLDDALSKFIPTPLLWITEPRTLAKITMATAVKACSGPVTEIQPRLSIGWTPSCYFGGAGKYKNYRFLLPISGADCNQTLDDDIEHFEDLKCKSLENAIPASAMFVELSPGSVDYDKILHEISLMIFW